MKQYNKNYLSNKYNMDSRFDPIKYKSLEENVNLNSDLNYVKTTII